MRIKLKNRGACCVCEIKDTSVNHVKTFPMYIKGNIKRLSFILIIDAVLKVEKVK